MKTRSIRIAALLGLSVFSGIAHAQNQPFWSNQGNGNVSLNDFLGTINNSSLIFKTNNQERGRFDANGNFVVNGNITGNKLYIGRIISTDSIIRFGDSTITMDNLNNRISWSGSNGINGLAIGNMRPTANGLNSLAFGTGVSTSSAAENAIIIGSAPTGQQLQNDRSNSLMVGFNCTSPTFYVGSTEGCNGKVGVGTTNPTALFEVNGTTKITSLAAGTGYKLVAADAQGNLIPVSLSGGQIQPDPGNPALMYIPADWNTGGNNGHPNDFIGTLDAFDFVIKTDGSERGRVSANGHTQWGSGAWRTAMGRANSAGLNYGTGYLGFNASRNENTGVWTMNTDNSHNGGGVIWGNVQGQIYFGTIPHTGTTTQTLTDSAVFSSTRMTITPDGRVGIGISNPNIYAKLSVKGKILAEEVQVALFQNWPDYVFADNYKLMSISELEAFIKANKHLPNIPPANEMEKAGVISIGEMQVKQLEKTEELYLYLIQLNRDLQQLKKENDNLKAEVNSLKQN